MNVTMDQPHNNKAWRDLEIVEGRETPFYKVSFANEFGDLVNKNPEDAAYVLRSVKRILRDDPQGRSQLTKKKLMEAKKPKMELYIKALHLQWQWAKNLLSSHELQYIQPQQKMEEDSKVVRDALFGNVMLEAAMIDDLPVQVKSCLHPCCMVFSASLFQFLV